MNKTARWVVIFAGRGLWINPSALKYTPVVSEILCECGGSVQLARMTVPHREREYVIECANDRYGRKADLSF